MRAGFLLAVLALASGYTWFAFAGLNYLSSAGRLGPGFFPRIIGVSLVLLCLHSLYVVYVERQTAEAEPLSPFWRTSAALAALSALFVASLNVLGGLLSMIAFLAVTLWFLNRGRPLQNALLSVLLPLCVYLLFRVWLNAAMPRGMLPLPL